MRRRADLASVGTYDCVEVGEAFPSFRQYPSRATVLRVAGGKWQRCNRLRNGRSLLAVAFSLQGFDAGS